MKRVIFLSSLILCGCDNNDNKKRFEVCVQNAEQKYSVAYASICKHETWHDAGECSYDIRTNNALLSSKDNEITACALMYAPK